MQINEQTAKRLWFERYGDVSQVQDLTGRWIYFDDYNNRTRQRNTTSGTHANFGWNIHHKQPLAKGGTNDPLNLEIVYIGTNDEAEDKTSFVIKDIVYEVRRIKRPEYGIYIKGTDQRVDWHR
ncbi:hypothetical protein BN85411260 [Alteracholeplasma palmae J233]|uniref:HNH endonuclease n=1 Tax=Alteracholeplasma palmae (strain ATCC 49389 / J233) TaxID=1318466 RepID=U4KLI5_ALTPJ|nr:HNH endonuclease signature motif containing protein [Alteracholeplasma palmae]CCV64703.1 hypothetical protein BN85411260 [Alteracholeplasma palmae J233]